MSSRYFDFWDVLRDNLSKIMIITGIVLAVVGLVMLGDYYIDLPAYAAVPTFLLFLGIVLVVYGFFVQVGLFSVKWMSLNGLGTVLLCIAVGFFAIAVVSIQIQLVTGFIVKGEPSRSGAIHSYSIIPYSIRPLLPIFDRALQLGAIFLAVSVFLKVLSFSRS